MKKNKTLRRVISVTAVLAVLAGAMFGARAMIDRRRKIPVVAVSNIADMWYDTGSSGYGQISQGGVQQVWNDSGKLVSQIYVSPGDRVKKGDPLVQYDISEARLEADNCRILYEMAKRDLNKAQERLEYINTFRPNERPEPVRMIFEEPVDIAGIKEGGGLDIISGSDSVEEVLQDGKALYIININTFTPITKRTFETLLSYDPHAENPEPDFEEDPENYSEGEEEIQSEEQASPLNFCFRIWANCEDMDSVQIATVTPSMDEAARTPIQGWFAENGWAETGDEQYFFFSDVYSVDEMTGNVEEKISDLIGKVFAFKKERSNAQIPETERYSQREIDRMIREQNDLIRELKIDVAQAELNWREAKQSSGDGIVRAAHDGIVMSVGDPYDSYGGEPFIQVGSGEGYQIVSTLTELQLGSVKVGDTITVNMWSNGMTYKGTIVKISPYPTDNSMSYYGSGNVSNYQFIADLECEDELQTWDGGEIILDSASDGKEVLFALMSAYVGEEGGRNYVLKAGEDGRVYRQYVETGKVVYSGWYVEIISGLSLDDYIAFPYGKNAVEGAKADYDSGVEKW
ncbi:MAG: hypothetical protein IKX72_04755 [Oscillospiraceae bacterium]|nr:hypothetical protein [Oscillospiraceae bacterium]